MNETHCWIELDSQALLKNIEFFRAKVGDSRLALVVKSNAYGHGIREVYQVLKQSPPGWLCVNYVQEGKVLRNLGYKGRVLILGPVYPYEIELAKEWGLEISIGCLELLHAWIQSSCKPHVHIKANTGLNRQGFDLSQHHNLSGLLKNYKELIKGIYTHFANVEDVTNQEFALSQMRGLERVKEIWLSEGFSPLFHASASASTLLMPEGYFDLCRIGISLYGLWPSELTRMSFYGLNQMKEQPLSPVLSWKTKVASIREIKGGEYIGYGCSYRSSGPMRIAVLSVGYYEGYRRQAANNNGYVLINGCRCRVLGRVCMNMIIVDVSHVPAIGFEEEAVLLGKSGDEKITAEMLADWFQTINYEALTCLNPNMPRFIK